VLTRSAPTIPLARVALMGAVLLPGTEVRLGGRLIGAVSGPVSAYADAMSDAPIELLAYNDPYPGVIRAGRVGEPSFTHVQDIGDAYMAAQERGVRVVVSQRLIDELRAAGEFPPNRPTWIEIRNGL